MAEAEHYKDLVEAVEEARDRYASELVSPSDESGARLIAAAITLAGARIAYQLWRVERKS